ncbi:hypothetical protein QBC47DRAFT_397672 [Echria macrotheca]|uniref:Glycine zipper 2TM domain-containing protein n=1 Tax=Echria macrotheca TaxID=438768 RepID=A0AAJ0FEK2_9PEZI|nr:hypothetical protein QBC47DRAFT_397672 [Echria macrotheca]
MSAQEYYNPSPSGPSSHPAQQSTGSYPPQGPNPHPQQPQQSYPQQNGLSQPHSFFPPPNSHNTHPPATSNQPSPVPEKNENGNKSLLATALGSTTGAYLGGKLGNNKTLNKIMGGAVGAIAANVVEKKLKDRTRRKREDEDALAYGDLPGPKRREKVQRMENMYTAGPY